MTDPVPKEQITFKGIAEGIISGLIVLVITILAGVNFYIGVLAALGVLGVFIWLNLNRGLKLPLPSPIIGRDQELDILISRIQTGQSSAIVGVFGAERTSILAHLQGDLTSYGERANMLVFSSIDIATLPQDCNPALFWEKALNRLQKIPDLAETYKKCQDGQFKNLEPLFDKMDKLGWQLVLMIDRFHRILLEYPNLKQEEFVGILRFLASSRHPSPLSLVVTLNISLVQFDRLLSFRGSSFVNFLEAVGLGALDDIKISQLLQQHIHGLPLSTADQQFLTNSIGGHPYLLGKVVTLLVETYQYNEQMVAKRIFLSLLSHFPSLYHRFDPLAKAKRKIQDMLEEQLESILKSWSTNTNICQAFISVVKYPTHLNNFTNELKYLEQQGLVCKTGTQWQLRSRLFSDIVANKLKSELC